MTRASVLAGITGAAFLVLAPSAPAAPAIRVMILDGQSGGAYHDWRHVTPVLRKELEETGLFQVEVVTAPQSGGDFSGFHPNFTRYQVIVLNIDAPDWPADLMMAFEEYVRNGGGLAVVHAADNAFPNWKAFNQMIGVGGWRDRNEKAGPLWYFKDGKLVSDNTPGPAGSHGARLPFALIAREPEHPILKGLPKVWMHAGDELYATLRGPGENMTVLATAHSDTSNKGTGRDEPILMVLNYGKGRIFHTTMGHDIPALSCVGFITTLQRGVEWAATGQVTQIVPANFPTAEKVSVREGLEALAASAPVATQGAAASAPNGQRRTVDASDLQSGDAEAGKRYFNGAGTCLRCHSPTGDLAGVASRYRGLRLEQQMLYPRGARSKITVNLPDGEKVAGTLAYQDEFTVALRDAAGKYRSWFANEVKYTIDAPAEAHVELFGKYSDADIHNLMAYLQTLR